MNKKIFSEYFRSGKENKEINSILESIESAKAEMEIASSVFDNVQDPLLIEVAIYAEQAAKKRYSYLVHLAKQKGLSVDKDYIIENCTKLAEY